MFGGLKKSTYTYLTRLYQRHWGDQQTYNHPNVSEVTMRDRGKISPYQNDLLASRRCSCCIDCVPFKCVVVINFMSISCAIGEWHGIPPDEIWTLVPVMACCLYNALPNIAMREPRASRDALQGHGFGGWKYGGHSVGSIKLEMLFFMAMDINIYKHFSKHIL